MTGKPLTPLQRRIAGLAMAGVDPGQIALACGCRRSTVMVALSAARRHGIEIPYADERGIALAVASAVRAERRRCLDIALAEARRMKGGKHDGSRRTAQRIAAAIRAVRDMPEPPPPVREGES